MLAVFFRTCPADLGTSGTICWPLLLQGERERAVPALSFEFALNLVGLQRARRPVL